jgi:hypothetical protein
VIKRKAKRIDKTDFSELFAMLPATENPVQTSLDDVPVIVHEDHRWLLPIAYFAQEKKLLPKPCTLTVFDQHDDGVKPDCTPGLLDPNISLRALIDLCQAPPRQSTAVAPELSRHLRPLDDDWVKAGMELGIFGDAVIFGGWERGGRRDSSQLYTDKATGKPHSIKIVSLPKAALSFKGELSDWAREFEPIWKILGWTQKGGFHFEDGLPKALLSIDLDCFACSCHGQTFSWPTKLFEAEFLSPTYCSEWTGKRFLHSLIAKAGIVAIARESECTGGPEESQLILEGLNSHAFDGELFRHGLGQSVSLRQRLEESGRKQAEERKRVGAEPPPLPLRRRPKPGRVQ